MTKKTAKEKLNNTRSVEYYRLWPGNNGDSGTWDTGYIDVPADTPEDKLEEAVRAAAAAEVEWREGEIPVMVGLYCAASGEIEDEEEDEEEDDWNYDGTPTTQPVLQLFVELLKINPDARLSNAHSTLFVSDAPAADKAPLFDELERLKNWNPADPFLAHLVPIKAEVHDDGHRIKAEFDARRWFDQASDNEILELARCGWGGNYPADEVACFMEDHDEEVAKVFAVVEACQDGFECHVDEQDALRWLAKNRAYVHGKLTENA